MELWKKSKITWYSNEQERLSPQNGSLEEDEITWFSNKQDIVRKLNKDLEEEKNCMVLKHILYGK